MTGTMTEAVGKRASSRLANNKQAAFLSALAYTFLLKELASLGSAGKL